MRTVDHISAQLRDKRLLLTRTVKDKKELLKADILNQVKQAFQTTSPRSSGNRAAAPGVPGPRLRRRHEEQAHAGHAAGCRRHRAGQRQDRVDALATGVRGRLTWYRERGRVRVSVRRPADHHPEADDDFQLVVNTRIDIPISTT
jgi:hypothetical protein